MERLRLRLRAATSPLHERVDAAFSSFELGSLDGYRAFLRAHAQVLVPLEIELEASGIETLLVDWPQRSRRRQLLADLAELDDSAPWPESSATPQEPGWCWGAVYVIEGSRLGGRVLAKRVAEANPNAPLRYLGFSDAMPSWPAFIDQLDRQAAAYPWNDVLAGACEVFERFVHAAQTQRR